MRVEFFEGTNVLRRQSNRWKFALLAAALAVTPLIGLNLLLWLNITANGRVDIEYAAERMLGQAEAQLDTAMTQLVAVSMKLEDASCSHDVMELLGQAIVKAPTISDITVMNQAGTPVCSPSGNPRVIRAVSPANDTANKDVKFFLVDFGADGGARSIQFLWRLPDGWSVSFLIPGERLLPAVVLGRLQADFVAQVKLVDGSHVAAQLSRDTMSAEGIAAFEVRTVSSRYPVSMSVSVPSSALWDSYRELFLWGNAGGAVLALLIIAGAFAVNRQMEGPARQIENSLRRGEFIPYYQPVMDIHTGKLLGCEVLVRRKRADGSVDSPGSFIPLVEATGQIFEITRSMMVQARDELGPYYSARPNLKVSFNLVAAHFDDEQIVSDLSEIFEGAQVKTNQIVLEVTERQPLPNLASARVIIAKLQELGARIALDDVGTGHGGMSYLLKLGVDQMKMDKLFVDAIGTDRYSTAIIDTLVKLAADLNIEFVAEGVETFEQVAYLREHGVHAAQGYVFSPPLPGPLFLNLIAALHPVRETAPGRVKKAIRGGDVDAAA